MADSSVKLFLSVLENPLIKLTIRFSTQKCPKCSKSHLEVALDDYVGNRSGRHHLTQELTSKIISLALNAGERAFAVDGDAVRAALQTPVFRRGLISVLGGIAEYGVTKPQRLGTPFLIVWNYTNACNLRCRHCYQNATKPAPDELSTKERLKLVDRLYEAGVVSIAFSGGEPLMRPDFFEVAKHAANKGIYVALATNGTMINKETAEKLKMSGVEYVEVSLDGATPRTHNSFRGLPCFKKTVDGIKHLVKSGLYTCVATTAMKHNLHDIPDVVELAKTLGVRRVIVFNFVPTGRGEKILNLDLSPCEREHLLTYLYDELVSGEIETASTAPQYARVCLQRSEANEGGLLSMGHFVALDLYGQTMSLTAFIGGCGAGRLYCAIQPNGLVTPCVFMPIVVGDLRRQSLRDIWLHSTVLNDLRDREKLMGKCGHCRYKYVCGGCRARAYAYHEDYLMPDSGCIRELEEHSVSPTHVIEEPLLFLRGEMKNE